MEVINCHDCKKPVSFSAAYCPHCGSREPSGSYQANKKEVHGYRIEEKNDRTVIVALTVSGAIGSILGFLTSPSGYNPMIAVAVLGFAAMFLGVLIAFVVNMIRTAKRRLFK
jgi:hypothetical protein